MTRETAAIENRQLETLRSNDRVEACLRDILELFESRCDENGRVPQFNHARNESLHDRDGAQDGRKCGGWESGNEFGKRSRRKDRCRPHHRGPFLLQETTLTSEISPMIVPTGVPSRPSCRSFTYLTYVFVGGLRYGRCDRLPISIVTLRSAASSPSCKQPTKHKPCYRYLEPSFS